MLQPHMCHQKLVGVHRTLHQLGFRKEADPNGREMNRPPAGVPIRPDHGPSIQFLARLVTSGAQPAGHPSTGSCSEQDGCGSEPLGPAEHPGHIWISEILIR
jgi:hypothetical protein